MFWSITLAVVLVILAGCWWSDRRRRGIDNPAGKRREPHSDGQVNEALASHEIRQAYGNGPVDTSGF